MAQADTEAGNTKGAASRGRAWCFTLNNYTDEELAHMAKCVGKWIIGKEVAPETGTPHLQGYVEFPNARRLGGVKKLVTRAHWELAVADKLSNIKYCRKEGVTIRDDFAPVKDPLAGLELHAFQKEVLEIIEKEPDDRTIYWFWEPDGARGKTSLAKSICIKRDDAILVGGKAADVRYGIFSMATKPKIVLWNISRSMEHYVSYQSIEEVKDGIFFNTKYESGMCLFDNPHIIIFANFEPALENLSMDRWVVKKIG